MAQEQANKFVPDFSGYQPGPQYVSGAQPQYNPEPQYQPAPQYTEPQYQPAPQYIPGQQYAPGPQYNPAPPPPYHQPMPVQGSQSSNTNVVVVQQQQSSPGIIAVVHPRPVRDHYFVLSVIMLILSIKCGLIWLVCSIPAVIFAALARDDERSGDYEAAQTKGRIALSLNLAALFSYIATIVVVFIALIITVF